MPTARVLAHMTMSLDGFIAAEDDTVGPLFDWYDAGPIEMTTANPDIRFHLDDASAAMMHSLLDRAGALVTGRHLFNLTNGWNDRHPIGTPVVVVTHQPPPDAQRWPNTSFVTGVAEAIAQATQLADGKDVVLASTDVVSQALDLGLVDEIAVSLVPVLLGSGKALFAGLRQTPVHLDDPSVIQGTRATHLRYRVIRQPGPDAAA